MNTAVEMDCGALRYLAVEFDCIVVVEAAVGSNRCRGSRSDNLKSEGIKHRRNGVNSP
jgi:hypothetical protein